jgi:uracil DNA glycosylase
LNIIQTSQRDKKDAHAKFGWQEFTTRILEIVSRQGGASYNNHHHQTGDHKLFAPPPLLPAHSSNGIVFMGWGEEAIQQIRAAGVASVSSIPLPSPPFFVYLPQY